MTTTQESKLSTRVEVVLLTPPKVPPKPFSNKQLQDRISPPILPLKPGSDLRKISSLPRDHSKSYNLNSAKLLPTAGQITPNQSQRYLQTRQPTPQTQQPPPQTQQPPLQTRQSPLQTQQSHLQTQQSPLQTQQPPLQTRQPSPQTQQSPPQTRQSPPQTQQSPPQTRQSPLQTQQPPPQPPLQTRKPPLPTRQPPLHIQQPPLRIQHSRRPFLHAKRPLIPSKMPPPLAKGLLLNSNEPEYASTVRRKNLEFETISEPMTIVKFLKNQGTSLPVLLKVSQGYASFLDKYSFGKDQLFVALGKKEIGLITCQDPHSKQLHEIPLDEELLISPVLPDCFTEEGIPSVLGSKELLGCSTLPRVFCAMKHFKDSKGDLVEQGTLLFTLKEGNPLVAITLGNVKICIDKSTLGEFSVRSSNTKVSLKEAVKYLKFPFTCRLFPAKGVDCFVNKIIVEKISKGVVIEGVMKTEEGHSVTSFQKPSIIPASSQIQVNIMKTRESDTLEHIYDYATKIYTSLKPLSRPHSQYQPLISDKSDGRKSHHSMGTPAIRSRSLPRVPQSANFQARSPSPSHVDNDDSGSSCHYIDMSEADIKYKSKLKNLQVLEKLTVEDVLLLLEKMNLNQYRDAFEQEKIDGILLASLDNDMLEELGVTKHIHRLRLKKIIEGKHNVETFIC